MANDFDKRNAALQMAMQAQKQNKDIDVVQTARDIFLFMDGKDPLLDVSIGPSETQNVFPIHGR